MCQSIISHSIKVPSLPDTSWPYKAIRATNLVIFILVKSLKNCLKKIGRYQVCYIQRILNCIILES